MPPPPRWLIVLVFLIGILSDYGYEQWRMMSSSSQQHFVTEQTSSTGSHDGNLQQRRTLWNTKTTFPNKQNSDSNNDDNNHICQLVTKELMTNMMMNQEEEDVHAVPHPAFIWSRYVSSIMMASRLQNDTHYVYYQFVKELMMYMTPQRLATSRKTLPNWDQMERMLRIVYDRYFYVRNKIRNPNGGQQQQQKPRKLHIIAFGGSVTKGTQCQYTPIRSNPDFVAHDANPGMGKEECSWPSRLERFLNVMLVGQHYDEGDDETKVVAVHRVTNGGSDTLVGNFLWEYALFQDDVPRHPDIILHGWSTNDAVKAYYQSLEPTTQKTVHQFISETIQSYIQLIYKTGIQYDDPTCTNLQAKKKPLLIFFDDYVGFGEVIGRTWRFNQVMSILTSYYGLGYISYADAVRDIKYATYNETWFTPREGPHPGQGMHITSVWMIAYNFLEYVTTYCSSNSAMKNQWSAPSLHRDYPDIPSKKPISVQPPIDWENYPAQYQQTIAKVWSKMEQDRIAQESVMSCRKEQEELSSLEQNSNKQRCLFVVMNSLNGVLTANGYEKRIKPFVTYNDGWYAQDDHGKLGYVPTGGLYSKFVMTFRNISQPVQKINIMMMKSYGPIWENSTISVLFNVTQLSRGLIKQPQPTMFTQPFVGYHDQQTSVSEIEYMDVTSQIGDDIQLTFQLVNGQTFKLMGLALCDH